MKLPFYEAIKFVCSCPYGLKRVIKVVFIGMYILFPVIFFFFYEYHHGKWKFKVTVAEKDFLYFYEKL